MKAVIEAAPTYFDLEFNLVVSGITEAKDEKALRKTFSGDFDRNFENLSYGFGGHHMWVLDLHSKKRIIIVYFENN